MRTCSDSRLRWNNGGAVSAFPINDRNLKSRHPHESKNPACRISVFLGVSGNLYLSKKQKPLSMNRQKYPSSNKF
ncbi:hypothetical protein EZZ76_06880 [Neisseria meningitidis]|nr:hypothetical protein [Neisseria meningitidis]